MALPVVVPAAGEGSRMEPLAGDRPKPLVSVAGRPLLKHVFAAVPRDAVTTFVVVTGPDDAIESTIGETVDGVPIEYATQPSPDGLGDAVAQAEPFVDGAFGVVNGDNVLRGDLTALFETHRNSDADATLLVTEASGAAATAGGVCVFDEGGSLSGYVEKPEDPPSSIVSAGAFVFEPVVFEALRQIEPSGRGELELTDAVDHLLGTGRRVETVHLDGDRVNVNSPGDVRAAEKLLGSRQSR